MFIFKETIPCPSQKEIFPAFGQPQWGWLASHSELNTKSRAAHFKHCPGIVRTLLGKYRFLRCCTWVSSLQPRGRSRRVEAAASISQPGLVSIEPSLSILQCVHCYSIWIFPCAGNTLSPYQCITSALFHSLPRAPVFHQKCLLASA